ncbi:MAG: hypothetical protein H6747_12370 [Deltaproteobacteria bacterium]|nr:hypothetical protein [Deltaproteobacteria bacterium]
MTITRCRAASRKARWTFALAIALASASCGPEADKPGPTDGAGAVGDVAGANDGVVGADGNPGDAAAGLDATPANCPGAIGCACETPADCDVPLCLDTHDGRRCSAYCGFSGCPDGWVCKGSNGGADTTLFCIRPEGLLCHPCNKDGDCQGGGHGTARCVDYGDAGAFCGVACKVDDDCPQGRVCREVASIEGGVPGPQCVVPAAAGSNGLGQCDCSPAATTALLTTTCWEPDTEALSPRRCKGSRACTAEGPGPCTLLQGAAALCVDEQCLDPQTKAPLAAGAACSDLRPCTEGDACDGKGACISGTQTCTCEPGILACPSPSPADAANLCKGAPYCAAYPTSDGLLYSCEPNPALTKVCDDSADGACSKNACLSTTGACQKTPIERTVEICDLPAKPGQAQKGCRREVVAADLPNAATTPCDDGLACSKGDGCSEGSCKADTSACKCTADADCIDDGDQCNGLPYCDKSTASWSCKVNPGTVVVCNTSGDGDCVITTCEPSSGACKKGPQPLGTLCDDGVKCTEGDICDGSGACSPGAWTCCKEDADCAGEEDGDACNGTLYCDKAKGACLLNPTTVVSCPTLDDTACRQNLCQAKTGKCALLPVAEGKACDDGSKCTVGETCGNGNCSGGTDVCACSKDADCAGQEDGDPCTGTLYCDPVAGKDGKGACKVNPKSLVHCPTVNDTACLRNLCDSKTGKCAMTPLKVQTACDADGTTCTAGDICDGSGSCIAGTPVCPCQTDADCADKEDGDLCNGVLYCDKSFGEAAAACTVSPPTVVSCPSVNDTDCLRNTCDGKTGTCSMQPAQVGEACEDGEFCTGGDVCDGKGSCQAGKGVCGCKTAEDCKPFDDASVCNGAYLCLSNSCQFDGKALDCNDNNACTTDSCDKAKGCVNTPNSEPCDADGDACTQSDACKNGSCTAGKAKNCDDANPCTTDSCNGATGKCVHTALADASICGLGSHGRCEAGTCYLVGKRVAAGLVGGCAVLNDGAVACWGQQKLLGKGSSVASSRPILVPGISDAVDVGVDSYRAYARRSDGTIWTWGSNSGLSGTGSSASVLATPTQVKGLSGQDEVSVGIGYACARKGAVINCWGHNLDGQVGISAATKTVSVPTSAGYSGDEVATGESTTCAISAASASQRAVHCWGSNVDGLLGGQGGFTHVKKHVGNIPGQAPTLTRLGQQQGCIHASGASEAAVLWCWGRNVTNIFGNGGTSGTIYGLTKFTLPAAISTFDIDSGNGCSVDAVGGQLRCWGGNNSGQLGNGGTSSSLSKPTAVNGVTGVTQISIASFIGTKVCARSGDGAIRCWGDNLFGSLGRGGSITSVSKFPTPGRVLAPL